MPPSEARIAAARANGSKSRGPATAEGKARSRANAYKHGMAGDGVVLSPVDSAEVGRRSAAMQSEMAPKTEMGRYLVDRLAELTVRVERCSRQERADNEHHINHAGAAFDEARLAEIDGALARIGAEPATFARKLRSMPEGVDRMIAELLDLREELNTGRWDNRHGERVAHLTGARFLDVPVNRVRALSEAISGDFQWLRPGEGAGLSHSDRIDWARNAMADRIDAELERLLADREALDLAAIERDRAGAAERALFDPSKEATLARRYEAAAERGVFRALRELREVEAEAELRAAEVADEGADEEPSGSFRAESPSTTERPAPLPPPTPIVGRDRLDRPGEGPIPAGPAPLGLA